MKYQIQKLNNKGYTLLFAVLVSSIVLSIGISILTISKKEYLLASSARESTSAFYAADSGLECAEYFNYGISNGDQFSTSTKENVGNSKVICNGSYPEVSLNGDTFSFEYGMGNNSKACAKVTVRKYRGPLSSASPTEVPKTTIISKGYNIGWNGTTCDEASSRRVERALNLTY